MSLLKAMATVGGLTAVSRVAGFIRDIMTAAILGAGPIADAFFVALKLPNFFRRITAEGAFSVSFVPLYSEAMEKEGRESADSFAGNAMVMMFWGLLAFTIVIMIAMPVVIMLIAPGFSDDPERYNLAVSLSRITFPYLLMMSVAALLGGVLNAHGRFVPFAAAPILFNLALIGVLLVAWKFHTAAHALAWGVLIAGILQFGLLYLYIRREKITLPLLRPRLDIRTKKLFRLMGPGVMGAGVMQINLFADMIIGSFLPVGSISYLYYADRLNQLPLSTVGIAVGTALLPMLSRAVGSGNEAEARSLFNRALEVTLFLGLPAALALLILANPIISVLFERGAFDAQDAHATARVLQGYAIGLPAYIAVKVYSTAFWSRQDTMTPVKISIAVTLANIGLALILVQFMGVAGIALATGIVGWLQIALLARLLRGSPSTGFDERFRFALPRIILSTAIMGAALYGANIALDGWRGMGSFGEIAALSVLVAGGLALYAGAIFATGTLKASELKAYLTKRKV
ncbi:MAG: murein biosynthesis integral membrane protein MurJ [Alphaproteobacteria bacterium]|nr:murein biosynthesis integral membrane protein MurJ [Alphaproteobacteria bacterium]